MTTSGSFLSTQFNQLPASYNEMVFHISLYFGKEISYWRLQML